MRKFATIAVLGILAACSRPYPEPVAGAVLRPGHVIEAANRNGSVRVSYISARERKFEWDQRSRTVRMTARGQPFQGELGLYDPADCFVFCPTPRLVVREAMHDFDSYEQLYAFVYEGSQVMDWAYTHDGLLVGFARIPERKQINVIVRQLTVQGERPLDLRGARDASVRLSTAR